MHCEASCLGRTSTKALLHRLNMLLLYLLHFILILLLALLSQRSVTHPAMPQVACIADSVYCNVFTIFTLSFSFSYLNTPSSPAEGLGSHVGWYEVILAHSS